MTEAEWLACTEPVPMLEFLRGKASPRKLRLFAVACCHRVSTCLTDETRSLVEIAERVAEGQADERERRTARATAMRAGWNPDERTRHARGPAKAAVAWALSRRPYEAARFAASNALSSEVTFSANWGEVGEESIGQEQMANWEARRSKVQKVQAGLLRCIFGPLLFRPVSLDPTWLAWHDALLVSMARQMYDSRDFRDLPVLADALEEAGCDNADILAHCRQPGPHVRGCWVVDLLLGKS